MKTLNMMYKNILVLSAGRRVELIKSFIEQRQLISPLTRIIAVDLNPDLSAACQVADESYFCPHANDALYPKFLLDFCIQHEIGLIIPTIDTELIRLAQLSDEFLRCGVSVSIPDFDFVAKCRNKRLTGELFQKIDVRYPKIFKIDNIAYPAFAKPIDGSSSHGIKKLNSVKDLELRLLDENRFMISEFVNQDYQEYTVDVYFDIGGLLKCAIPRLRIETRAGEISKGQTRRHGLYKKLWKNLSAWNGVRGCVTVQVFYNEEHDDVVGIEINPRFGGGYPLSYAAGGNFPGWLIQEYFLERKIEVNESWEDRMKMLRYDASVILRNA